MDSSAHRPRLCHLRKTPDFAGYGFNLHAEKGKSGQFIGNVDPGSPAQTAGLRKDDRIVEVNGTNVGNENHSQVVERIKAVAGEVTFLVVDPETDAYYHDNKIIITGDMDNIERIGGGVETAVEHVSEPAVFSASDDIATQSPSVPDADVDEVVTNSQPERVEHAEDAEEVQVAAFSATEVQDDHSPLENGVNSTDDEPESVHARLCELKTWSDFAGYGFNLHANRGEPAQFIGKIDAGSPAEYSGLKEGDRIVEVNGINVDDATHSDVVRLIKSGSGTVSLLVVDSKADEHFKNRGQTVASHMSSVERITCPDSNPLTDSTPLVSVENTESAVVVAAMSAPETDAPPPSYVEAADDAPVHHPHRARVCVIHSWKDGRGYGFSMQAQKGDATSGQFIGKIDAGSPAEAAGLRSKDRIIEVNGENIETATHKVVVEKIKSVPDLVRLLVVDAEADNYYTGKGIKVSSLMDNCVERIESPATKPAATAHAHKARHCVINSWKDGRGYGFSMQAQKGDGSAGQFIGKIDAGSPAEAGGLRQGDRIIEVNGDNVEKASHKEVVDKIKSVPDTVKLLVVDSEADKYFKNAGINVSSSMADCIEQITCPTTKPAAAMTAFAVNGDSGTKAATAHAHKARHCVINSWKDGRGYGFSMQAQKGDGSAGQFIGKIDAGSPAEAGGLRQGDRIIEVNGDNVEKASHKEVVDKIKSVPDTVKLLVVDSEADKYFKNAGINVSSSMADCIEQITCPTTKPAAAVAAKPTVNVDLPSNDKPADAKPSGSTSPPVVINGIEFAGSAQEARKRMSKKKSVVDDKRSMKDKYELFQKM